MTTYLSPIGYDSTRVTRPILSRGLDASDHVVLLLPENAEENQRSSEAIADVQRLLQEIEPNVSLSEEVVPHSDFQRAVFVCTDLIQSLDDELVANFGGGPRDIYLAFPSLLSINWMPSRRFSDLVISTGRLLKRDFRT